MFLLYAHQWYKCRKKSQGSFSRNFRSGHGAVMLKLLLVPFLALFAITLAKADIQSVALVFRHGQRTPTRVTPNYGFCALTKELGLGQLTLVDQVQLITHSLTLLGLLSYPFQTGSRQLYDLGTKLRNRYSKLFPASGYYRLNNMEILSSPSERCIASLSSFMAGFFPPPAKDKTIPFPWQAFPFSVDNKAEVLYYNPNSCPSWLREYQTVLSTEVPDKWMIEDRETLDRVQEFVGIPLRTYNDVGSVAETIRAAVFIDPKTPQWLIDVSKSTLEKYFAFSFTRMHSKDSLRKIRGGPLLTRIVNNMQAITGSNSTISHNFMIFSGHDMNTLSLANVIGIQDQVPVLADYADCMAVELHQPAGNVEPTVQIRYISTTAKTPYELEAKIPGCPSPCRLSAFVKIVEKFLVPNYNEICA